MRLGWCAPLAAIVVAGAGCIPPALTYDGSAGDGAVPDGSAGDERPGSADAGDAVAASDAPEAAPDTGAPPVDGGGDQADRPPGVPRVLDVAIAGDQDDATWARPMDERLHWSATELAGEVGADSDMGAIGLRFALDVPLGSRITSASLGLYRLGGNARPEDTARIQVFDTVDVAPFDDAHVHDPAGHAPEGLWAGTIVTGFRLCDLRSFCDSPDVAALVQHVVDKPAWRALGAIGFVLSADQFGALDGWAQFIDSSYGSNRPVLHVVYVPPS